MQTLTYLFDQGCSLKKHRPCSLWAFKLSLGKIKVITQCFLLFTVLFSIFLVSKLSTFATKTLNKAFIISSWSLSEQFSMPNNYFTHLQQLFYTSSTTILHIFNNYFTHLQQEKRPPVLSFAQYEFVLRKISKHPPVYLFTLIPIYASGSNNKNLSSI